MHRFVENIGKMGKKLGKVGYFLTKKVEQNTWVRHYFGTPRYSRGRYQLFGVVLMCIGVGFGLTFGGYKLYKAVFALTETTYSLPSDLAFNAAGYGDGSGAVAVLSSEVRIATSSSWMNGAYLYKKQVTLRNNSTQVLHSTSSAQISVNTKALYDAGKLQDDCDDLRMAFVATASANIRQELPRSYAIASGATNCSDSTSTVVTFPVKEPLWVSATDSNYELYYGNSDAVGPAHGGDNGYDIQRIDGSTASATLVCPFNGTTTCTDGETPTAATGAIRYGGGKSAMSFDGSNDNVETASNSDLSSATKLTVEYWSKSYSTATIAPFAYWSSSNFLIYENGGGAGNMRIFIGSGGTNFATVTAGISQGVWTHIAVVFDGDGATNADRLKVYVNGVSKSISFTGTIATALSAAASTYSIGALPGRSAGIYLGYIDEVRVSNSLRYTSDFTPSTEPFKPDLNTKLLYHFDENGDDPRNTGKAIDASGNGNHGTITGAKYVGGLVGIDSSSSDTGSLPNQSYASHQGVFIEEGTTNLVTNPSFDHTTYNTNWGLNYLNYATASATFTAGMAKRNSAGPFAAGVLHQGSAGDLISVSRGNQINNYFYDNWDGNQGSIVFWWTPEYMTGYWNSLIGMSYNTLGLNWDANDKQIEFSYGGISVNKSLSDIAYGTTYLVIVRWDTKNTLDGTNYGSITINNSTTFGDTSPGTPSSQGSFAIGSEGNMYYGSGGIFEGITIYRRPLYETTTPSGINVGNGDEIAQIYNASTGRDPTIITGSWDVVFALPTNASTGSLTTGTGNAWSHPHSSNLLYTSTTNTGGFMMNGTYTTDGWADKSGDWWTAGGITTATAAYQAISTTSQAASYINRVNPGTNDLTEVVAPSWSTDNGWSITSNQQLTTGITSVADGSWSLFAKFANKQGDDWRTIVGGGGLYVARWWNTSWVASNGSSWTSKSNMGNSGVVGVAGTTAYLDGVDHGGITGGSGSSGVIRTGSSDSNHNWIGDIYGFAIFNSVLTSGQVTALTSAMNTIGTSANNSTVSALASNEKIFSGGYKSVSSGLKSQGIYRTFSATNGGDYVLRALGHSDGTCSPQIKVTRADGTTEISHLNGSTTSTRTAPDVYVFTWESPAAENEQVQLINTASSGTCYWHQVEVLSNGTDNPSMERTTTADPYIPPGWRNGSFGAALDAGDSELSTAVVHSGSNSVLYNSSASNEGIKPNWDYQNNQTLTYFTSGSWVYGDNAKSIYQQNDNSNQLPPQHSATGMAISPPTVSQQWAHLKAVYRAYNNSYASIVQIADSGAAGSRYVDDAYYFSLQSVSLTVTPADQTNSTETSGLRVDGSDTLTQSISGLSATRGIIKFKYTPRHNLADANKFGYSFSSISIFATNNLGNGNSLNIIPETTSQILLRGTFDGTSVDARWTSASLTAGTTYAIEIEYTASSFLKWKVNGVTVGTSSTLVPSVGFSTLPTIAYFGGGGSNNYDGTITSFVAMTPTENTTAPNYKFGSKSAKLTATTDYPDQYTTSVAVPTNGQYTLSAYVFNGTTSAIGGTVDSTVAALASGSAALSTTYTDMGGGWWRLTNTSGTQPAGTYNYGVEAKPGKTVYVDGMQVEGGTYASSYADGALGTGYSWSGTAHQSTSVRANSVLTYPNSGQVAYQQGSVSFWFKPYKYATGTNGLLKIGYGSGWGPGFSILYTSSSVYGWRWKVYQGASKSITITPDNWYHVVFVWGSGSSTMYVNASASAPATFQPDDIDSVIDIGGYNGNYHANAKATMSDVRFYNLPITSQEVAYLYNQGLATHTEGTESNDRYNTGAKTYTSPVIDLGANGQWGTTPFSVAEQLNSGTISYSTRTSSDSNTWSDWAAVSGNTIASDPRRYLQWKADLTTNADQNASPVISGASIMYVEDSTPPQNPSNVALGYVDAASSSATLTSGTWYNHAEPKFTWDEGVDAAAEGQSASGIASYKLLLTTDQTATPSANVADDCYATTAPNARTFTVGTAPANCVLTNNTYYLRLQTVDNSGNHSDPVSVFTYKYDGSAPNAPASVSTTNVGYQATNSFTFYWPTASDNGPSGLAGYEYKTGTSSGALAEWQFTTDPQVADITAYQEGQNFFFVRSKDIAGNYSGTTSNVGVTTFYYNQSAPTAPTNVSISPSTSSGSPASSNVFSVAWDKPSSYSGEIAKYYYCVNCTPSATTMTETSAAETAARALTNVALATQQGKNTFYIVAEDNNVNASTGHGNRNFDAYASVEFYASTTAPGAPTNLTVSDASDRDASEWRLTLAWKAPASGGSVDHYEVHRSTDNTTFTKIGEVTATAYTDTSLTQGTTYYYKVRSIDNANSSSLFSGTVTEAPEGKYTEPATASGTPSVTVGSSTAVVTWSTGRETYGTIEYGKTTAYGSAGSETTAVEDHSIKLTGLVPGTTYYYRIQSLDESSLVGYDRDDAYSTQYTFTTLNTAAIADVTATDQTLTSVVINFTATSLASAKIEYGETKNYGTSVDIAVSSTVASQSKRLSGLKDSTLYHFRLKGVTLDGTDLVSDDYTFETVTFPKVTAFVLNTDQTASGTEVVLAWATNVSTSARVQYQAVQVDKEDSAFIQTDLGKKLVTRAEGEKYVVAVDQLQALSQSQLLEVPIVPVTEPQTIYIGKSATRQVQRITGLTDGAIYVFTIVIQDQYGNEGISDPVRYVTGADTRPPVIENVVIETPVSGAGAQSQVQIIVSWETDEPSTGQVLWGAGTGAEYPQATEKESELTTKHVMVIRDLDTTASYHLKIVSADKSGNVAESKDTVVVTPSVQEAAFDIILQNLEDVFGFLRF